MLGLDAFDFVVTSKSALSEKPDRRIFDVALEQARSAAERMPLQREPAWRDKLAVALNWDELADAIGSARSYVVCDEHGTNCRLVDALSKKYVACDEHGDNCRVTVDDNTHHRVVALVEDDARSAEPIDPATPISPDECLHIGDNLYKVRMLARACACTHSCCQREHARTHTFTRTHIHILTWTHTRARAGGGGGEKDYAGARAAGGPGALLDRFGMPEWTETSRKEGAPVMEDLMSIVEYIARHDVALGTEPRVSSST